MRVISSSLLLVTLGTRRVSTTSVVPSEVDASKVMER